MPDYDKLLESIRVIEGTGPAEEQSLYNEFEIPDEPLPEFLEGEENLQKVE